MFLQKHRRWKLMVAILTLSLLTVMAGAAVAPALGVIQEYFSGESKMMVQLIISMPAMFIAVTNLFFEKLCRICKAKTLTLIGLGMYIIFGCGSGLFSNIYLVLVCRALVGVGVGIIMPMSTGLITYYFTRDKQDVLMGYSSAMNMLGGVVATLIAGALAMINWRMSFLVYLLGVSSIVPVALWMPNERIIEAGQQKKSAGIFRNYYSYIVGMFFLMVIFFNYPANFAMESSRLRKNPGQRDCERHILPRGHFAFFAVHPVVRAGGGPKTGKIGYIHFLFAGVYCLIRNSIANAW